MNQPHRDILVAGDILCLYAWPMEHVPFWESGGGLVISVQAWMSAKDFSAVNMKAVFLFSQ